MRYLWTATFIDGIQIDQPSDDRYSKHDDNADWNPTAFRDIQEYDGELEEFSLYDSEYNDVRIYVNLYDGVFYMNGINFSLEDEPLTNRKLIYYRIKEMTWVDGIATEPKILKYAMGYEGKNSKGKIEKKVIYIDA